MELDVFTMLAAWMEKNGIKALVLSEQGHLEPEYGRPIPVNDGVLEDPSVDSGDFSIYDDPDLWPDHKKPEFS